MISEEQRFARHSWRGLGAVSARSFYGPMYLWAIIMMLGGVALACIGAQLNIAGAG
ncbi:MAG: hypothetical protein ACRECE_05025 [Xanthobacteraceae bacterium]